MSIVCLCASHIHNTFRLKCLNSMIQSWNEQILHCHLYLSISYDDAMKQLVDRVIASYNYDRLHVTIQLSPLKQFEHYKHLLKLISNESYKYIIFTDDDDLWHHNRVKHFDDALSQITLQHNHWLSVKIPNYVTPSTPYKGLSDCFTAQMVSDRLKDLQLNDNATTMSNYVTYVFKTEVVERFLQDCNVEHLQHKFCDMLLLKYIKHCKNGQNIVYYPAEKNEWMYYYRYNTLSFSVTNTKYTSIPQYVISFGKSLKYLLRVPKQVDDNEYVMNTINNLEVYCFRTSIFTIDQYLQQTYTYSTKIHASIDKNNVKFITQLVSHRYFQNFLNSPVFGGLSVLQ